MRMNRREALGGLAVGGLAASGVASWGVHRRSLGLPVRSCVTVYAPASNGGKPYVVDPFGRVVGTNGTKTDGIQEALRYAAAHGYNVHIAGGQYLATTSVVVPALSQFSFTSDSFQLEFPEAVGAADGLVFDSLVRGYVNLPGLIRYCGTGRAVVFEPRNPASAWQVSRVLDSKLFFGSISVVSAASRVVYMTTSGNRAASIVYCEFNFVELVAEGHPGRNVPVLFEIDAPHDGFSFNFVSCPDIHGFASILVSEGTATKGRNYVYGNDWNVGFQINGSIPAIGFQTYANFSNGRIHAGLDNVASTYQHYINYAGNASNNYFEVFASPGGNQPTGGPIGCNSTAHTNTTVLKNGLFSSGAVALKPSPFTFVNTFQRQVYLGIAGGKVTRVALGNPAGEEIPLGNAASPILLKPGYAVTVSYVDPPAINYLMGD